MNTIKVFCRGSHNDNGRCYVWLVDEQGVEHEIDADAEPFVSMTPGETYEVDASVVKEKTGIDRRPVT